MLSLVIVLLYFQLARVFAPLPGLEFIFVPWWAWLAAGTSATLEVLTQLITLKVMYQQWRRSR